jgi:hypothetical protein
MDQIRVGKKIFESKPEGGTKVGKALVEMAGRCRE